MALKIVGLTGGIGSGKSTVARLFADLGVPVVDTDDVAHALTGPGGAAMPALVAAFGDAVRRADGALDRAAMRDRVFADPAARARLEGILHPLILAESRRRLAELSGPYAVLVVPLLFETPAFLAEVATTLLVDADEDKQIERVVARSGLAPDAVRAIMAAQLPREERRRRADAVIVNNDDLAGLALQVAAKHRYYLAKLANPSE
ncbi:dephospho-CoA kinase [Crenobacter luteus]|uniref:Dephospho-CoA kinase n=1 Tax=Crenobacter luteus TaxID=1452487 RepID=A0A165F5S6_9NEIS|nr:dephospho-CoA kinase [Crenobacter luteus]KZE31508.1 dephospho-CoA kinase [Crenobacter luteus]